MFRDVVSDTQLALAKKIVNQYPVYGETDNYLGDLEVITLAGALGIAVISLEGEKENAGKHRPKIPNILPGVRHRLRVRVRLPAPRGARAGSGPVTSCQALTMQPAQAAIISAGTDSCATRPFARRTCASWSHS